MADCKTRSSQAPPLAPRDPQIGAVGGRGLQNCRMFGCTSLQGVRLALTAESCPVPGFRLKKPLGRSGGPKNAVVSRRPWGEASRPDEGRMAGRFPARTRQLTPQASEKE